jgi:hypothetical protein
VQIRRGDIPCPHPGAGLVTAMSLNMLRRSRLAGVIPVVDEPPGAARGLSAFSAL